MHFLNEHMWSHPPVKGEDSAALRSSEIYFQCDLWQYVEHYTLQQAHITVLLIMQLTAKTQLILQAVIHMSIAKWTVVVLCHTEQHASCYACFFAIDNVQHTANLERF